MIRLFFAALLVLNGYYLSAQNVIQAEYFIDADAGVGNNKLVTLNNPSADGTFNFNVSLTGLSIGYHKLYIRVKDSSNHWSIAGRRNIEITSSNIIKRITGGEYYFDIDPGYNLASAIIVTPQDTAILQNFGAVSNSLSVGYHKLYIRLRDNDGNWSITARRNVEVMGAVNNVLTGAEYFFNSDPGPGSASQAEFIQQSSDSSFSFKIPLADIPTGAHTLYLRSKDNGGKWSLTQWIADSVVTTVQAGLWSDVNTWSNKKIPDAHTVVVLHHDVTADIDGTCKSLALYRHNVKLVCNAGKKIIITGNQNQ